MTKLREEMIEATEAGYPGLVAEAQYVHRLAQVNGLVLDSDHLQNITISG
jgi:hypothetical protein